jgi:hypothetical protein
LSNRDEFEINASDAFLLCLCISAESYYENRMIGMPF